MMYEQNLRQIREQVNALSVQLDQLDQMLELESGGLWAGGEFEDELMDRIAESETITAALNETLIKYNNRD